MTSIWMKALWVTLCSVILAVIINFGFEKLKPYLGVDEINYMKYYYDKANALPHVYPGGISEDIVLVTTQSRKRGEIARLIQQICQKDPLALGVDMRFVDERDPRTDSLLLGVLTQYRNKLILARARGNGIKNSFFDRGSEDALFTYGLTHIRSSLRYCPQTGNPPENLFSYAVAQKVKPDIAFDSSLIVNYETCYFHKYTEDEVLQMTEDDELRGKIVILGDDQDNKDFHDMPFLIAGQDGCQGLYLQAYAIRSLLDDNVAFKELSFLPNLLICFLLTYVFSLIFSLYLCWGRRILLKKKKRYPLFLFSKPLAAVAAEVLILLVCYYSLTLSPFHCIPDVVLFMISILLINSFDDFIENLYNL